YIVWVAPRLVWYAVGVGGERLCQIEKTAADVGVIDLIIGADELARIASAQQVGIKSLLSGFRKPAERRRAHRIGGVEEELHRDVEDTAQLVQAAGADPV